MSFNAATINEKEFKEIVKGAKKEMPKINTS